ncbi:MAG: hypothetical protein ACO1SV_19675 [Fimbriimonas sp.]
MRKFALALTLSLSGFAAAQVTQTQPTYEQILNQTFANLNGMPDVTFQITGTERVGDRITPFDTTLIWHRTGFGPSRTEKVVMQKRVNGALTQEVRGSGASLYSYDYVNRTYYATAYHQIRDTKTPDDRDAGYHTRLLAGVGRLTTSNGPDSYLARIFQEAMGDPAGQTQVMGAPAPVHYRSWMPGRQPQELPATLPPTTYPDPVVPIRTRTGDVEYGYTPTEKNRYFLYDGGPRRSIVFHVYQPELESPLADYALSRIFFGEASQSGGRQRLVQWTLSISYPVVSPADAATYETQFLPYTDMRGWRPLASPGAPKG